MVDEKVSWMKKFGITPEKSDDASREDLKKKIEDDASSYCHFDQMSKRGFNLMRDADDIYQITRKFKQGLLELTHSVAEVTLRDICVSTGYPEGIVSDIIKYLGSDIIAKENNGVTYFSLSENC